MCKILISFISRVVSLCNVNLCNVINLLTRVLQVGGGVIYPRPSFLTTAPILFGIFWNASVTFPRYIYWLQNPKRNFPTSVTVPQILVGKRAPQMAKNWFQAYLRLGVPQIENLTGISMFSRAVKPATLVLTSLDGICKPEVDIHQNRK